MDYQTEREMELEALEAILMDDLQVLKDGIPGGWSPVGEVYRVVLTPNLDDAEAGQPEIPVRGELVFAHTHTYPDTAPLLRARGLSALSDDDVAELQSKLDQEVESNLGMAMIYTLITAAQEWMNEKAQDKAPQSLDPAVLEKKQREAEEARLAELRAHGTAVTPEAFRQWQEAFEAEQGLDAASLAEEERMTGKRYFQLQESRHADVDETPSGSDEEGWDAPVERDGIDYDDESSDEEFLLDQLAADRGET